MTTGSGLITRRIGDIKSGPRVRCSLNNSRVEMFMELYTSGANVPPIEIYTGGDDIRAGHHRREALHRLGWDDRKFEFKQVPKPRDFTEMMVDAFADNVGGAQPPSYQDSVYVIKALLEKGVKSPHILKTFSKFLKAVYPEKMVKGMITTARRQISAGKTALALTDIRDNDMKVSEAEIKHGLPKGSLKGKIGKKKAGSFDVEAVKKSLSGLAAGHSRKIRTAVDAVLADFEAGTVEADGVIAVIAHVERLNERSARAMDEARARLEKLGGPKSPKREISRARRRRKARGQRSRKNSRRSHRVSKKQKTA